MKYRVKYVILVIFALIFLFFNVDWIKFWVFYVILLTIFLIVFLIEKVLKKPKSIFKSIDRQSSYCNEVNINYSSFVYRKVVNYPQKKLCFIWIDLLGHRNDEIDFISSLIKHRIRIPIILTVSGSKDLNQFLENNATKINNVFFYIKRMNSEWNNFLHNFAHICVSDSISKTKFVLLSDCKIPSGVISRNIQEYFFFIKESSVLFNVNIPSYIDYIIEDDEIVLSKEEIFY